jgi:hypothetical protein
MHESVDVMLDRLTMWIWNKAVLYALTTTHFISEVFNKVSEYTSRSVKGAMDAHKEPVWLFTARNSVPWTSFRDEYTGVHYPIIYYPETKRMFISPNYSTESESFGDVVLANMSNEDSGLNIEMSSTFHGISWFSSTDSPSLYEVALIHCLSHDIILTEKEMGDFSLDILTADSASVRVRLDSSEAKAPFNGWDAYCAEQVKSDSSSTTENIYNDKVAEAEANSEVDSRPKID